MLIIRLQIALCSVWITYFQEIRNMSLFVKGSTESNVSLNIFVMAFLRVFLCPILLNFQFLMWFFSRLIWLLYNKLFMYILISVFVFVSSFYYESRKDNKKLGRGTSKERKCTTQASVG